MLAELHGKFESLDGVPADHSEDLLTDAVFGALRYLPYGSALAEVFRAINVKVTREDVAGAQVRLWPTIPMPAWPGTLIEPDVMVIAGSAVVVFEAKLLSPFSFYHDPAHPDAGPYHQLAVQYAATRSWASGLRLSDPVMVAVTAHPTYPSDSLDRAVQDIERLTGTAAPEVVRWLPWHRMAEIFGGLDRLRPNEQALVDDVLQLMDKRGVRKVFTGFPMEDYWLVTAAQRVASSRLYPQMRTFFDELTVVLGTDDVYWSQPNFKGMWLGGASTSVSKPADWTRSFVGAPYWPSAWPARGPKNAANLALYAIFDFRDPALEVGLSIPGLGATLIQQHWAPHLPELASQISALDQYELVLDAGDLARPVLTSAAADVQEDWLATACAKMLNAAHLRLRQRLTIETVTVQQAREALGTVQQACNSVPALWKALHNSGHITAMPESGSTASHGGGVGQ
jgi:hypothetical protein